MIAKIYYGIFLQSFGVSIYCLPLAGSFISFLLSMICWGAGYLLIFLGLKDIDDEIKALKNNHGKVCK